MNTNIIDLSTAGITLKYCVETTAGTRPSTGYTRLHSLKSTPSLNPAPETIESTPLDATEWKEYVQGLKDLGGALEFGFNLNQNHVTEWSALMTAYQTGIASSKATWFVIEHPSLTNAVYFKGQPSAMGIPEASVNAVWEVTEYITPLSAPAMYTKPTA